MLEKIKVVKDKGGCDMVFATLAGMKPKEGDTAFFSLNSFELLPDPIIRNRARSGFYKSLPPR